MSFSLRMLSSRRVRQLVLVFIAVGSAAVSYAQLSLSDLDVSTVQINELKQRGELSQEDAALYAITQNDKWDHRLENMQEFLSRPRVPEVLRRKVTFQYARHFEVLGKPADARQLYVDWLNDHPDDPAELGLRMCIAETLSGSDDDSKISAEERFRQLKGIVSPIAKRYPAEDLDALRTRSRCAAIILQVGYEVAEEWASSDEARKLSEEVRNKQKYRMVLESTEDVERELTTLKAIVDRLCAPIPKPKPVDMDDPYARESPEYNLLAGVVHQLKETAALKQSAIVQIETSKL